jgi:hypothetical protein
MFKLLSPMMVFGFRNTGYDTPTICAYIIQKEEMPSLLSHPLCIQPLLLVSLDRTQDRDLERAEER